VRSAAGSARWVTSVCTGSGVLAAAGLLQGRRATKHWAFREGLRSMGVDVVPERVVFEDPVVTAAGVSAGIDMALDLTARLHGEATAKQIRLIIEYDPRPPFDVGSVEKADEATIEAATQRLVAAM
jgi:cyclohexyl-isocyanide hydratase